MRYVNGLTRATGLLLCAALFGCSTGGQELQWMTEEQAQLQLVPTDMYLPVQEQGDEGQWLPYEPQENPYEAQRGRVDKDSVTGFIQARRAFKAEQWDTARGRLEALIESDEDLSGPWVMLGDIAMEQDETEQALEHYAKAISVNRDNINAYLRLGYAQRTLGRFLHAQNTYAEVLSLWPDYPEAHLNLAILYDVYLNHPLRAQKHMEAYQFLTDEDNPEVAQWLAEIRSRTGIAPSFEQHAEASDTGSLRTDEAGS